MEYQNICRAEFLARPNRFVAHARLEDGSEVVCHVKNTGRCRELLLPGATVLLEHCDHPGRKTQWDLVAVYKGQRLINMDAQAPNKVFADWAAGGGLGYVPTLLRGEQRWGDSRFDFYLEGPHGPVFAEVKGVTLEENGVVRFPDAPTERGVKHLQGLTALAAAGRGALCVFIVQMEEVRYFAPNDDTHPAFGAALREAAQTGVRLLALDCRVTETGIAAKGPVEVHL